MHMLIRVENRYWSFKKRNLQVYMPAFFESETCQMKVLYTGENIQNIFCRSERNVYIFVVRLN